MAENRPTIRITVTKGTLSSEVEFSAYSVDEASRKLARDLEGSQAVWRKELEGLLEAAIAGKNAKVRRRRELAVAEFLLFLGAIIAGVISFIIYAECLAAGGRPHHHH